MATKQARFEARERPDGLYDLHLMAANGEHLWNDAQGRPKGNVRRDLARIKRNATSAGLVFVKRGGERDGHVVTLAEGALHQSL